MSLVASFEPSLTTSTSAFHFWTATYPSTRSSVASSRLASLYAGTTMLWVTGFMEGRVSAGRASHDNRAGESFGDVSKVDLPAWHEVLRLLACEECFLQGCWMPRLLPLGTN